MFVPPLTYLRTFVFICGSIFFASPLVSDDDQGLTARGPPRQEARHSTANERKWAGDRAGTERGTAFPGADCRARCWIRVERQSRALNSPVTVGFARSAITYSLLCVICGLTFFSV